MRKRLDRKTAKPSVILDQLVDADTEVAVTLGDPGGIRTYTGEDPRNQMVGLDTGVRTLWATQVSDGKEKKP